VACRFPFVFRNKKRTSCTSESDKSGRAWCSTKIRSDGIHVSGNWGHCDCQGGGKLHRNCLSLKVIIIGRKILLHFPLGGTHNPPFITTKRPIINPSNNPFTPTRQPNFPTRTPFTPLTTSRPNFTTRNPFTPATTKRPFIRLLLYFLAS
jgi:hypothetical protein